MARALEPVAQLARHGEHEVLLEAAVDRHRPWVDAAVAWTMRMAFCGGMDFAGNRWDTPTHLDRDPRCRTPEGRTYQPRHDVMPAVAGAAAAALGDLARERWCRATGERIQPPSARLLQGSLRRDHGTATEYRAVQTRAFEL
jgi:phosphatidylserine/phosphatidylglycerophosphate/cardiolipin synthase-like enzyme